MENDFDVLVIGAGPAGLTAATYLGRFLRRVLVADGGQSRADWIPVSHNMPGFPAGVSGPSLLERLRLQALEYGAALETGRVEQLALRPSGFAATVNGRVVTASAVLLATGVLDRMPNLPGVTDAVRTGLVRICPICDGYEARGRRVAVIGDDDAGVREAAFLRTFTDDVTLLHIGPAQALTERAALDRLGIALTETAPGAIAVGDAAVRTFGWDGTDTPFDYVYSALGTSPQTSLARGLGAEVGEDGRLIVDDQGQTSVEGFFAAGDVVRGLNQIAVATAEAAISATAIHNRLRLKEGKTV